MDTQQENILSKLAEKFVSEKFNSSDMGTLQMFIQEEYKKELLYKAYEFDLIPRRSCKGPAVHNCCVLLYEEDYILIEGDVVGKEKVLIKIFGDIYISDNAVLYEKAEVYYKKS
jgi:hypothetical protein